MPCRIEASLPRTQVNLSKGKKLKSINPLFPTRISQFTPTKRKSLAVQSSIQFESHKGTIHFPSPLFSPPLKPLLPARKHCVSPQQTPTQSSVAGGSRCVGRRAGRRPGGRGRSGGCRGGGGTLLIVSESMDCQNVVARWEGFKGSVRFTSATLGASHVIVGADCWGMIMADIVGGIFCMV
jgi:hypothetical protein